MHILYLIIHYTYNTVIAYPFPGQPIEEVELPYYVEF